MDKALLRGLSAVVIISTILAFALALSPLQVSSAKQLPAASPSAVQTTPGARAGTPTTTTADRSVPGSTDGIVIMSFAIALIIVLPILLQRGLWGK